MSEWSTVALKDIAEINPRESIKKGDIAVKVAMDKLQPFCRDIPEIEYEVFSGGTKFRNGDTIMARITPCLENGKTAMVNVLDDGQVGFGSTEYIVFRAKKGISDPYFLYYLVCSPMVREPAIKSMVGSSGRQRVQTDVVQNLVLSVPSLPEQVKIGEFLKKIDDKIAVNNKINRNLSEQCDTIYRERFVTNPDSSWSIGHLSDLITVKYGKDHKKLKEGDIPCYGSGGVMRYVEKPLYDQESVLIPRKGTLNNVMYVNTPFWSVDTMFFTMMKTQNVAKFVYHSVKEKNLASMNAGSAVPSMTTDILNAMEILIPSAEALAEFEAVVQPLYNAIQDNETENKKLAEIRDSLLPKLMSGELDVSNLDI